MFCHCQGFGVSGRWQTSLISSWFSPSTCGLAEELEREKSKEQMSSQPKSACGNVSIRTITQYSQNFWGIGHHPKLHRDWLQLQEIYCLNILIIDRNVRIGM